jgi:lipid-binding SYLF domain-containing protein
MIQSMRHFFTSKQRRRFTRTQALIAVLASLSHNARMKKIITVLLSCCLVGVAFAASKASLDQVIHKVTAKFNALQAKSDKAIPAETLARAQGIILLDRTKAGFLFAFQGGGGLAMVKHPKTGKWSAPAFLTATEASLGFQIGGQQSFVAILLMTTNATRMLTDGDIEFGGEASGTAGDSSAGVEGKVNEQPSVLVYDDRKGLYGGAAIKGGAISVDDEANATYYGQYAPLEEVLFKHKFKPSEAAEGLIEAIQKAAK